MGTRITDGAGLPGLTKANGLTTATVNRGDYVKVEAKVGTDDPGMGMIVHTNTNNVRNNDFYDLSMDNEGGGKFVKWIRIERPGNYTVTTKAQHGDWVKWQGQDGHADLNFRPRMLEHDALNIMEVQIDQVNDGTFAGMTSGAAGDYTLDRLQKEGVTAIWLMPPFETVPWAGRHPCDDKGSPYAVSDYHTIKRNSSRAARDIIKNHKDDPWGEKSRDAANAEFKEFVEEAHKRGIKVFLDVALNHLGHQYTFRDRFTDGYNSWVEKNNFKQVAVSQDHLNVIEGRLRNPSFPKYLEYLNSSMFARADGSKYGATNVNETIAGGWGDWPDTKQLNHGAKWGEGHPDTRENLAVLGWLERILTFWAADVGVDGFRMDHTTGLPEEFLKFNLNRVQDEVEKKRPGTNLYFLAEDFHHQTRTAKMVDNLQAGWYKSLLAARRTSDIRNIVDSDYFRECLATGSHDENRAADHFGNDLKAYTRHVCMLLLLGGPSIRVLGDEYGERKSLRFRQWDKVPTLMQVRDGTIGKDSLESHNLQQQASLIKRDRPSLRTADRHWLLNKDGYTDETLTAFARHGTHGNNEVTFVFINQENDKDRYGQFRLDDETKSRIDPNAYYNVRNVMSVDGRRMWPAGVKGSDLLKDGLKVNLKPYEVQALLLEKV